MKNALKILIMSILTIIVTVIICKVVAHADTSTDTDIDGSFTVTIPKSIQLDDTKTAEIQVNVSNNTDEYIVKTTLDELVFKDSNGKDDVKATVEIDNKCYDKGDTTSIVKIDASGLTAGDWTGQLNFNISLNEPVGVSYSDLQNVYMNIDGSAINTVGDIVIPSVVMDKNGDWYKVNSIKGHGFTYNKNITSVVFPNTLITIGDYAFYACTSLTGEIIIPDSVQTIDTYAFFGSSITKAIIGSNISENKNTIIGNAGFSECQSLSELIIGNNVSVVDNNAFATCTALETLTIGEAANLEIRGQAFAHCGLKNINFPTDDESHIKLGYGAFQYDESLENLYLPKCIDILDTDYSQFFECNGLTKVEMEGGYLEYLPVFMFGTYSGNCNFTITIPDSVKKINNYVFGYKSPKLIIYKGVEYTSLGAFKTAASANGVEFD